MNLLNIYTGVFVLILSLYLPKCIAKSITITNETTQFQTDTYDKNLTETQLKLLCDKLDSELKRIDYVSYQSGLSCRTCRIFVSIVREFWTGDGFSEYISIQFTIQACITLRIQHRNICKGVINEYRNELVFMMGNMNISSEALCSALLVKDCGVGVPVEEPWDITLPDTPKPPVKKINPPQPGSPVLKVLHLTDVHIDLQYKENTSSECGEPLCCRENNGPGNAGYWGSYGCDLPMRTFENALKHIQENHKDLSHILLTGDIPPHNVWEDTEKTQIEIMKKVFQKISQYFPDKKVFVSCGNHDTHPANSFPPPSLYKRNSVQWLFDDYADMWSPWLPSSALSTIRKGGFYTVLVSKGFRIVSINNNYCNKLNWWLLVNNTDPVDQLQWLIKVLQDAEDKGEKVHIIAHIPTGNTLCFKYWSSNYYKIIHRYENTVAAQFCGHTHQDHFEIFYDIKNNRRPVSLWYIAPSLTTSDKYQPTYRIYEIDGDHVNSSRVVLDHQTFVLDLEKSNEKYEAIWKLEYSAKDVYNMTSLHPKDWDELVQRMENDEELFQKFYRYKYHYPLKEACGHDCKRKELCELKSAQSAATTLCHRDRYIKV